MREIKRFFIYSFQAFLGVCLIVLGGLIYFGIEKGLRYVYSKIDPYGATGWAILLGSVWATIMFCFYKYDPGGMNNHLHNDHYKPKIRHYKYDDDVIKKKEEEQVP